MNRRTFLATTTALAASTVFSSAEDAPKKRPRLRKAVNLGMAGGVKGSVSDKFKAIRDAGFEGIELNLPGELTTDQIIEAKNASGLEVAGIICTPHWSNPLSSPDQAKRERTV
jgi:hexulose-6-phosphate isomerase